MFFGERNEQRLLRKRLLVPDFMGIDVVVVFEKGVWLQIEKNSSSSVIDANVV